MDLEDWIVTFNLLVFLAGIFAPFAKPYIALSKRDFELGRTVLLVSSMMIQCTVMALKQHTSSTGDHILAIIILPVGIAVSIGLVKFCNPDFWSGDRD